MKPNKKIIAITQSFFKKNMKNVTIHEIENGFLVIFSEGKKHSEYHYRLLENALKEISFFYKTGYAKDE